MFLEGDQLYISAVAEEVEEVMILSKEWRFIDTGIASAAWNMAVDEALLENFKENDLPILRLCQWEPALSLGRFSKPYKSLDARELQSQELPLVRRMTGGGVLVHSGDLSYTLLLPRKLMNNTGVKESYRYLCRFLLLLYEKLGYRAAFAGDLSLDLKGSDVCLAGNEAYDIMIGNKKMGGNAQRYTRQVLFQHGSIPIEMDKMRFEDLFLGDSGLQSATSLRELGSLIEYKALVRLIGETFKEAYGARMIPDTLSVYEEQRGRELLADKYTQQRWTVDAEQNVS